MNIEVMQKILQKIKEYDRIFLFRHIRPDGDCVGATKGFKRILQLSFPQKEIYLIDQDIAKYLEFMGPEDEAVADEIYADALGIVAMVAMTPLITIQLLGFRAVMHKKVRDRIVMKRILSADDEQIIRFM